MHKLIELPRSQWPKLRDLYKQRDMYASSYQTIQNFIEWTEKEPELPVKIFTINQEWAEHGTFLIKYDIHVTIIVINTLTGLEFITPMLDCLEPEGPYLLFGMQNSIIPEVEEHCKHSGLEFNPQGTFWMHCPKEEAIKMQIDPPEGVTLRPLQIQNAEQVNEIWPHKGPGSIEIVKKLIQMNLNVSAYDEDGNLIAWCLRLPIGSLGLLQVLDEHKRKGYGSLVVRYMSKKIAEMGLEVMAPVVLTNDPSRLMFEKLGFRAIDRVFWAMQQSKS